MCSTYLRNLIQLKQPNSGHSTHVPCLQVKWDSLIRLHSKQLKREQRTPFHLSNGLTGLSTA